MKKMGMMPMSRIYWLFVGWVFFVGACATSESPAEDRNGVSAAEQALSPVGQDSLSSDGPFTDTQSLINYWIGTSTGNALTQIYVNGREVWERSGFSPAFVRQYFACSGGGIYAVCPNGFFDGYSNFNTLISRSPTTATIDKDDVLFRSGTNNLETENISSACPGDPSFYGMIRYYKVIAYSNGFISVTGRCYP